MKTRKIGIALTAIVASLLASGTAQAAKTAKKPEKKPETPLKFTVKRLPIQQERITPAEVVEVAPGHWFLDFRRAAFAGLELELTSPAADRKITVRLGEARSAEHAVNRKPGGSIRFHEAEIALKAGRHVYVVPLTKKDERLMPPEIGPVMPFRYVEIEGAPSPVAAADARQLAAHYPFDDKAAHFACSDPKLNAIWEMCKYTMKATSYGGVFVDGDRERLPYEADAYINQLGWYCTTGDTTLPRYTHEYLIQRPTWPTEWIMFSVLMAWADYQYTGDATSLKEFYPDLKAKTLMALRRPDGLISTVEPPVPKEVFDSIHFHGKLRDIVDWPLGERDGCEMRPVNTVVNAMHFAAMIYLGHVAQALGKESDGRKFYAAASETGDSIEQKLFDQATGLYVDGEGSRHSSLHANMFSLALTPVPDERRRKVIDFVRSRGMACSVYGSQFLMEALFDKGEAAHAMALMTADSDRSWTHMIDRVGTTIALEAWDNKYKPNQDWNHAWGAAPANILPRKVLGVEPLKPGFAKIEISPRPGKLTWAEGRVPTVRGPVSVRWENRAGTFRLQFETPAGMTARVGLPAELDGEVRLDDGPVEAKVEKTDFARFVNDVPGGKHVLVARKAEK